MVNSNAPSLKGEEKAKYLRGLDRALEVLAKNLATQTEFRSFLKDFGEEQKWDWSRLPSQEQTYARISQLVERVRAEYQWLDWKYFPDQDKNRGYLQEISINPENGLPWPFDLMELHRLRKEAPKLLAEIPDYHQCSHELRDLLTQDLVAQEEVKAKALEIHQKAMRRSFLEQLQEHELLGWESNKFSLPPKAKKILNFGGEELWNIVFIRYSLSSGMFQAYIIDLWQDICEPQIIEEKNEENTEDRNPQEKGSQKARKNGAKKSGVQNKPGVSERLAQSLLGYGENNAAWYILQDLDDRFESLHPVHVSRALIGPFENKYLTKPSEIKTLPISQELVKENPETGLLRFSLQYAYAPNHHPISGERIRQDVYRESWHDEAIVCPAAYASRVAKSVLGTKVKVFQI